MLTRCRPNSRARALLSLLMASALTASLWVAPSAASRKLAWSSLERSDAARAAGPAPAPDVPRESAAATEGRAREAYGKLGLSFEANHGQTDERVRFITRVGGATVFLTQTEAVFLLRNAECGMRNECAASVVFASHPAFSIQHSSFIIQHSAFPQELPAGFEPASPA